MASAVPLCDVFYSHASDCTCMLSIEVVEYLNGYIWLARKFHGAGVRVSTEVERI